MLKRIIKTHTARLDFCLYYRAYFFLRKAIILQTAKDGWSLALATFYHFLSSNLDNNKDCNLVDGISFDFSAAFDRVDHTVLLHKLHNYGIRGNMLGWIQSFLSDRKRRVVFNSRMLFWLGSCFIWSTPRLIGKNLVSLVFKWFNISDNLSSPLFQIADGHTFTIVRCIISFQDHQALQNDLDNIRLWTLNNNLPLQRVSKKKKNGACGNAPLWSITVQYFPQYFIWSSRLLN